MACTTEDSFFSPPRCAHRGEREGISATSRLSLSATSRLSLSALPLGSLSPGCTPQEGGQGGRGSECPTPAHP
eukprot:CAMPEP_0185481586 /NCGR_PEP_ID=MMETSP1366-20130426/7132_1 /TAXON_ID=38817 /ORGANISM="Gephyrocapsa oceanica, Strain RCC1303" /LENGTH=72 /DNA_ID=CAMNT_0028089299 /DNA_START=124 /DNA_END=338 /DNA_ORIENTATION=+